MAGIDLQALQQALAAQSAGKGEVDMLALQTARAKELRKSNHAEIAGNKYGKHSTFGALRDAFSNYKASGLESTVQSALPSAVAASTRGDDMNKIYTLQAARQKATKPVELTNPAGGVENVQEYGGEYYKDGEKFDATGHSAKQKLNRASGSRYSRSTSKDQWGNDVQGSFDKFTGGYTPTSFADGSPWSEQEGARRGGQISRQKGDIKHAEATGAGRVAGANASAERGDATSGSIRELDNAISAVRDGANTGPIANMMPNFRDSAVKLQAAKDQLALFEIGKYTFGSLSEAEGNWLKDVVIPTRLDEDELLPWLENKREGLKRALDIEDKNEQLQRAGFSPMTRTEKDAILYADGFQLQDSQ